MLMLHCQTDLNERAHFSRLKIFSNSNLLLQDFLNITERTVKALDGGLKESQGLLSAFPKVGYISHVKW